MKNRYWKDWYVEHTINPKNILTVFNNVLQSINVKFLAFITNVEKEWKG